MEKIVINDIEYNVEDLSDKAKYFITQISNLNDQTRDLEFRAAQIAAAKQVFENSLIAEVTETSEE